MAYLSYNPEDEDENKGKEQSGTVIAGQDAGSAAGNPAAGGVPGAAGADKTKSNFVSAKKIIDANKGSTQADLTNPYTQQISQNQTALQGNLADYQKANAGIKQGVDDASIKYGSTASQGGDAFSNIMNLFSATPQAQTYGAPRSTVDETGLSSLNSQAGIRAELGNQAKKAGVANYGRGMGALDAAVFNSDPNSRAKVTSAQEQLNQFKQSQADAQKQADESAAQTNSGIAERKKNLQDMIASQAGAIQYAGNRAKNTFNSQPQQTRGTAVESEVKAAQSDPAVLDLFNQANRIEDPSVKESVLQELKNRMNNKSGRAGTTLANFLNPNAATENIYNNDQANEYSNIMKLLGQTDQGNVKANADKYAKQSATLDTKGLNDWYNNMVKDTQTSHDKDAASNLKAATDKEAAKVAAARQDQANQVLAASKKQTDKMERNRKIYGNANGDANRR